MQIKFVFYEFKFIFMKNKLFVFKHIAGQKVDFEMKKMVWGMNIAIGP